MNVSTFHSLFSRRFFSHFLVYWMSVGLLRPRGRDCCAMLQD